MRLLLVEDDRKAARVLKKGLAEEGATVDVASSGDEGEYLATANEYDLIVLDWLLPGKDGIQVAALVLDPAAHRVTRGGATIKLTAKEYAILEFLLRHAGEVVTGTTLAEHIWENDFSIT